MLGLLNSQLFEAIDMVDSFVPVDLATGANTGLWYSVRDYHRFAVVLERAGASGHSADVSTITVRQASDSSGTGAKSLTTGRRRYKTDMSTAAGDTWVIDDTTTLANTYTSPAGKGDKRTLTVMEFEGQALDDVGGFHWVQASVDQASNSCIGYCVLVFFANRHSQRVPVSTLTSL
jgi:hypothetical protein